VAYSASRSLKDPPVALAYKEYNTQLAQRVNEDVLASMTASLETLLKSEGLPLLCQPSIQFGRRLA